MGAQESKRQSYTEKDTQEIFNRELRPTIEKIRQELAILESSPINEESRYTYLNLLPAKNQKPNKTNQYKKKYDMTKKLLNFISEDPEKLKESIDEVDYEEAFRAYFNHKKINRGRSDVNSIENDWNKLLKNLS